MEFIGFLQQNNLVFYILIAVLGLSLGSFINVVIHRLPLMLQAEYRLECEAFLGVRKKRKAQKINLFWPRSHCPHCKARVSALCNIPLLSFFYLRGRCKNCGVKISWRYPLVEFISAVLAVLIAVNFGVTWQTLALCVFVWVLLALVFIDINEQILPDQLTIGLLWLGLILSVFGFFQKPEDAILGAFFGYLSLWVVAKLFEKIRHKEGMGHGDFKLFAALGAWLGWQMLPFVLLLAALSGMVVGLFWLKLKKKGYDYHLPFGPYLAIAGMIMLFFGQTLLAWYWQVIFSPLLLPK
jgi:leader peptidase (prepilin peptidase) / N-methyltransferase